MPGSTGSVSERPLDKHLVDAAALLVVLGPIAVEDDAVAALDRRRQLDRDAIAAARDCTRPSSTPRLAELVAGTSIL